MLRGRLVTCARVRTLQAKLNHSGWLYKTNFVFSGLAHSRRVYEHFGAFFVSLAPACRGLGRTGTSEQWANEFAFGSSGASFRFI